MKTLKLFYNSILILSLSSVSVMSEITASTPTNLIQKIASASSFTSTSQSSVQNANVIQNTTSTVINGKELRKTVEQDAKTFGLLVNEAALERESGEASTNKQMVKIGGAKNIYEGRKDLEPTLDTIVYDTGLMTLTKEAGHYNNDNTNTIFDSSTGAQQARIKVYVDFKRKVLWGDIESKVTLSGGSQMTNTYIGGSSEITSLPVDKELTHTLDTTTGQPFPIASEVYPWETKHATTSLVRADGSLAPYQYTSDKTDMLKNVSHGTGGDSNVYVGARFTTTGSGTPGQSTASFEATHAATGSSDTQFADGVVRYSATVTSTAKKFKAD